MSDQQIYVCTLCGLTTTIPPDATKLTRGGWTVTYKFVDNSIHTLKKTKAKPTPPAPPIIVVEKPTILPTYNPPTFIPTEVSAPPACPQQTELVEDGHVDAEVVEFSPKYRNGRARVTARYRQGYRFHIMVSQDDVITEGYLAEGTLIRAFVGPPDEGRKIPRGRSIQVYEAAQPQQEK